MRRTRAHELALGRKVPMDGETLHAGALRNRADRCLDEADRPVKLVGGIDAASPRLGLALGG